MGSMIHASNAKELLKATDAYADSYDDGSEHAAVLAQVAAMQAIAEAVLAATTELAYIYNAIDRLGDV